MLDNHCCCMPMRRLVDPPNFFNAQRGCGCCQPPPPPPRQSYYYYRPQRGVACSSCPEGFMPDDWLLTIPNGFFDNIATQPTVPGQGACPYPGTTLCQNHTGTFLLTPQQPLAGVVPSVPSGNCVRYSAFYVAEGTTGPIPGLDPGANVPQYNAGCISCASTGTWAWMLNPVYIPASIDPDTGDEIPASYKMWLELGFWSASQTRWIARATWLNSIDPTCSGQTELSLLGNLFENSSGLPLCCDDLPESVFVSPA